MSNVVIPKGRPQRSEADLLKLAHHFFGDNLPDVLIIGNRGYYLDSQGVKGENDIETYDDAVFVLVESKLRQAFNANCDPSKKNRDMAMLDEGIYYFYQGKHKGEYDALRAYPEGVRLPCKRQNRLGKWYKSFCSLINIHKGYFGTTGSAGCQTIIKTQWSEFIGLVYGAMNRLKRKKVTYLLVEEKTARKILGA